MTVDATLLLRRLEPAVRPAGDLPPRPIGTIETQDFSALLAEVDRGAISSGTAPDASALRDPPNATELARLGDVFDVLAARGVRRALIVYGVRPFVADVTSRRIEQELSAQDSPETPVSVDAAIRVACREQASSSHFVGPSAGARSAVRPLATLASPLAAQDSHSEPRSVSGIRSAGS